MNGAFNPHPGRRPERMVRARPAALARPRPESTGGTRVSTDRRQEPRPSSRIAQMRQSITAVVRSAAGLSGATSARASTAPDSHAAQRSNSKRLPPASGPAHSERNGAKTGSWAPSALLWNLGLFSRAASSASNAFTNPNPDVSAAELRRLQQQQQSLLMPDAARRKMLAGDLRGAADALEEALARAVAKHGADSAVVADLRFSHGQVWTDTASAFAIGGLGFPEDPQRALESAERARDAFEQVLRVHKGTGNRLMLAHTHRALMTLLEDGPSPDYEDAEAHAEEALRMFQRRYGNEHDETCAALQDVTRLRLRMGETQQLVSV